MRQTNGCGTVLLERVFNDLDCVFKTYPVSHTNIDYLPASAWVNDFGNLVALRVEDLIVTHGAIEQAFGNPNSRTVKR